jgi:hypothetical protein
MQIRGAGKPGRRAVLEENKVPSDLIDSTVRGLLSQVKSQCRQSGIVFVFNKIGMCHGRVTRALKAATGRHSLDNLLVHIRTLDAGGRCPMLRGDGLNRTFIHSFASQGQRTVFGTITTLPLGTLCFFARQSRICLFCLETRIGHSKS